MDKVNPLGAGISLAVTLALISGLCAVAFVLGVILSRVGQRKLD